MQTNPTIWQYAKKAGFRTVYIDGQSGLNKDPGMLQNFMTMTETRFIDKIYRFEGIDSPLLDYKLLEVMKKELSSGQPVFIYANKNGAHFPYDEAYPKSRSVFQPTMRQVGGDGVKARVNSYLNALKWSVDGFFAALFKDVDLHDTAVIYTSDHGQALYNGQLTHCTVENPDPREGLVPMFAITQNQILKKRFIAGAALNHKKASHFAIRSTVLDIMGYDSNVVKKLYGVSLFEENKTPLAFTSGDVFGVFAKEVRWSPIDLKKSFMEPGALPKPHPGPMVEAIQ